ncbi:MAG: EamA family transporter, partial [Candidatus Zixiibacteriota bacterium]
WWAIASSLPKINASRSGLALLLQPVLATVWGVLFFGEYLTPIQIAGALITLAAIYVGSVRVH